MEPRHYLYLIPIRGYAMQELITADLVVIGGGPSGFAAAMRALDFGKHVVLVERNRLGGAGVSNGALSSKTWWALSQEAAVLRAGMSRYRLPEPEVSMADVRAEVQKAVQERIHILEQHAATLPGLQLLHGQAMVKSSGLVEVIGADGIRQIRTNHIILATGSRPRHLPDIPVDEQLVLTSDGIENLDEFPGSMVIVGAGVIGCEYATIFSGFGKTKVFLIDKGDRILPFEDEDLVSVIEQNMEAAGVHIHRNARLKSLRSENGKVRYELEFTDGRRTEHVVDKALISVGRVPNTEGLWDASVAVAATPRGITLTDETSTSVSGIHAVGDLTADISLVNVGELEGRFAVERIFGNPKPLVYENISTIMFLSPEVAGVGLNESRARELGLGYRVATLAYSVIPRAIAMRTTQGFIKLLVTDDDDMRILGLRVVGHQASSAIQAVAVLISMNRGIAELAECVHPHPSITEGIQECVRALMGKSILKPSALGARMECRRVPARE